MVCGAGCFAGPECGRENRSKWIINHDFVFYQINDFSFYTETIIKIIFTHETTDDLHKERSLFFPPSSFMWRWRRSCAVNGCLCDERLAFVWAAICATPSPPTARWCKINAEKLKNDFRKLKYYFSGWKHAELVRFRQRLLPTGEILLHGTVNFE